ncbi:hypothetical protein JMJ77_0007745 [Colletotrichum scovillei]|uniref:Uncharacterized protein n=1 Tax=Colletotrichum scovillei TaxID=1209932 RepID=A0A9P7UJ42_9PEZI|nr:hypothetical protein JMJ77_0007745 [Colletotrichum scovillei]KAG7074760.1 hypothetical protein JMJ76_0011231 [Colletotrichum scovillei]KAG7081930.1 hypothetical protein JMJ78_0004041 [Colletotrichum scovillei]
MRTASAHLLLFLLSSLFWNCTGSAVFYTPPAPGPQYDFRNNPQYALGEIIDIQWSTDDRFIDLFLVQTSPNLETLAALIMDRYVPVTFKWRVSFDGFPSSHDPDLSNVYYLHLQAAGQNGTGVTCHYFNITRSDASSVSPSALSSASPTAALSSSTLPSSVGSPTTTSSALSTPELGRDGLSTGAVAGIAVGATFVGTLVVVGLAAFLFWRRWRNNKRGGGEEAAAIATANDGNEIHVYKKDVSVPSRELYVESSRRFGAEASEPREMRFEMSGDSIVGK